MEVTSGTYWLVLRMGGEGWCPVWTPVGVVWVHCMCLTLNGQGEGDSLLPRLLWVWFIRVH